MALGLVAVRKPDEKQNARKATPRSEWMCHSSEWDPFGGGQQETQKQGCSSENSADMLVCTHLPTSANTSMNFYMAPLVFSTSFPSKPGDPPNGLAKAPKPLHRPQLPLLLAARFAVSDVQGLPHARHLQGRLRRHLAGRRVRRRALSTCSPVRQNDLYHTNVGFLAKIDEHYVQWLDSSLLAQHLQCCGR